MDPADASRLAPRAAQRFAFWFGPLLILASVLFALRGFIVDGALTNQHPDLLTFWLPRWSFLGDSVASGRIPLWNPFEMAGYRFAADPQSGWLSAAPTVLFSLFSPGLALRIFIVCNPLLAGLGVYAFLRKEDLGRAAATVGGLVLAMMMATSTIAISLPFAGALGWTAVLLLAAAGYRRSERWSGRFAWLALGAFAWMQVAAAHMSHGLVIGDGVRDRLPGCRRRERRAGRGHRTTVGRRASGAVPCRPADRRAADPRATRRLPRRVEPARRLRSARRHRPIRGGRSARFERRLGGLAAGLRRRAGCLRRRGRPRVRPPRGSCAPAPHARGGDRRARARRVRAHVPPARDGGLVPGPRARDPVRRRVPPQPRAPPIRGRARAARSRSGGLARPRGTAALPSRRVARGSAPRWPRSSSGRSSPEAAWSGSRWSPRSW